MPSFRINITVMLLAGLCLARATDAFAQVPFIGNVDTRVFTAIDSNDEEAIKVLIESRPRLLETKNSHLQSPLIYALIHSNLDIVRTLLDLGANANSIDGNHKKTPLHWAITFRNHEAIKLLLQHKPDFGHRDIADETPFGIAIRFGVSGKVLETMIDRSDLRATNKLGASYLYTACWNRRWDLAETLIDQLDDKDLNGPESYSPINIAYTFDGEKVVSRLLDRGCTVPNRINYRSETILMWAIRKNDTDIVKTLLQRDFSMKAIQDVHHSALIQAVSHRADNVIPLLLENGADVSSKKQGNQFRDVIAIAIENKLDVKIIKQLIAHHRDFDPNEGTRNWTYLGTAAYAGSKETIRLLLSHGADVNSRKSNDTVIATAAKLGNIEIFDYLIENGARRDIVTEDGSTLFLSVCQSGNLKLVQREIQNTNDINTPNKSGATPFYVAAFYNSAKPICELLLRHGAQTDAIVNQGGGSYPTPLHYYSTILDFEMVEFMLQCGVGVNCCSKDGNRPAHHLANARVDPHQDGRIRAIAICKLLKESGANFGLSNAQDETPVDLAIRSGMHFLLPHMIPGYNLDQD